MAEVLAPPSTNGPASSFFPGGTVRRSSSQNSLLLDDHAGFHRAHHYNTDIDTDLSTATARSYSTQSPTTSRQAVSEPSTVPSSPSVPALDFSRRPSYISTPPSSLSLNESTNRLEDEEICFPVYEIDTLVDQEQNEQHETAGFFLGPTVASTVQEEEEGVIKPPNSPDASAGPFEEETVATTPAATTQITEAAQAASAYFRLFEPETSGGDDLAVQCEPSRHVDYLSHTWKEEDIWASWRYISGRRKAFANSARLENAAWRTWAKCKHSLQTVSPDTLNWMKDHDVTWLYGPLLTGRSTYFQLGTTPPASQLSRSNSFIAKKPILKKRSLSERMLQRSLSSSTLMKQATDALRAQQPGMLQTSGRPGLGPRKTSDFTSSSESETPLTQSSRPGSCDLSASSSGLQTPSVRRHIHFNDKVEQCIAINEEIDDRGGYFDYMPGSHGAAGFFGPGSMGYGSGQDAVFGDRDNEGEDDFDDDDDNDDDGILTMPTAQRNRTRTPRISTSRSATPRSSFSSSSGVGGGSSVHTPIDSTRTTIAMLPATTLNYRADTPEPAEKCQSQNQIAVAGLGNTHLAAKSSTPELSPSPSVQTLRPPTPSTNFLIDDDDEEEAGLNWQPKKSLFPRGGLTVGHRRKSSGAAEGSKNGSGAEFEDGMYDASGADEYYGDEDDDDLYYRRQGLRRTESGMFMPYEEEDGDGTGDKYYPRDGLLGRMVDTVNTARDIAHVIWNVGWKR